MIRPRSVGLQNLINFGNGESTILLCCGGQDNITQHIKGRVETLRLVIPNVAHLKSVLHNRSGIEQAAVEGIESGTLVMDVNIAIPASLTFVFRHEEAPVESLIQLIENQAALCGNQSRITVGVFFVTDITNRLAALVDLVHHVDEVFFVIAIIPIGLGNPRVDLFQNPLHETVHLIHRNLIQLKISNELLHAIDNLLSLVVGQFDHHTVGRLPNSVEDFLRIEVLKSSILLNHFDFHSTTHPSFMVF